jgi:hypothetical protein
MYAAQPTNHYLDQGVRLRFDGRSGPLRLPRVVPSAKQTRTQDSHNLSAFLRLTEDKRACKLQYDCIAYLLLPCVPASVPSKSSGAAAIGGAVSGFAPAGEPSKGLGESGGGQCPGTEPGVQLGQTAIDAGE